MTSSSGVGQEATDDVLIATSTESLREEFPDAVAILLKGSHASGDAGPHSDTDFDVLIDGPPVERYPLWIEPDTTGRMRHVSVAAQDLPRWLAEGDEPEPWAFGLPVREPTRLQWVSTPELRERLDRPWREHPPGEPEIEDWFESYGKMQKRTPSGRRARPAPCGAGRRMVHADAPAAAESGGLRDESAFGARPGARVSRRAGWLPRRPARLPPADLQSIDR
jgi:hypothetical protein